jgi:hypothetical protein
MLRGRGRLALRVGIVSGVYLACYLGLPSFVRLCLKAAGAQDMPPMLGLCAMAIAILVVGISEGVRAMRKAPWSPAPLYSVLFLLLAGWAPFALHEIAYPMWTGPDRGFSLQTGVVPGTGSLPGIHMFVMAMAAFLSVRLWIASALKPLPAVIVMSAAALASAILSGVAVYQTVPRGGDDATLLWFILVPCALLVAFMSLLTCILAPVLCAVRVSRSRAAPLPPPGS